MNEAATKSITEVFVLLGIGIGIIFLRLYARWKFVGFRRWEADDYLMILAMLVYTADSTLAYQVVAYYDGLANNGMTDEERAALDPNSDEYMKRVNGSKIQVPGWILYAFQLWIIKAALCTMFLRLTERLGSYRFRIKIGFGLIIVTWFAVLLALLFGCHPLEKNWQINPDPGLNCQPASSRINVFVCLILNVSTDIYLLSIPMPMLWAANIKRWKKFGLIVLFSGGIFVTMAGALRCALIIANPITGAQDGSAWAVREEFVAIVTSNMPLIFPLLRSWFGDWVGTFSSHEKSSRKTGVPHGSIPLPDRSFKGKDEQFHNGGQAFASGGSQERIVAPPESGIKVELNVEVSRSMKTSKNRTDSDSDL